MLQPLDQVIMQVSRTDQQLQLHLILEQQETNRLLRQMVENQQVKPEKINNISPTMIKRKEKTPQTRQKRSVAK